MNAYGEVKIWFHLILNSALRKISGQFHASRQSVPVWIEKHAGGPQSCPSEKRKNFFPLVGIRNTFPGTPYSLV